MVFILSTVLTVLAVIAHPDDEIMFSGLIYSLTHHLNATVDLVCVTNGEGGFTYSGLSEPLYGNLKLSEETVGRTYLPRIRQQELLGSGRILVLNEQWDKEWVIQRFQNTIKHGNGPRGYDLMIVILPSEKSHGHHTLSGLLALEAIDRLQQMNSSDIVIPTVIGGTEFFLTELPTYPANPLAEILTNITQFEFHFNLRWLTREVSIVDYLTILLWIAAEHKSQGGLIDELLSEYSRDYEQYYYFAINEKYGHNNQRLTLVEQIFTQIAHLHQASFF